MTSFLYSKRQKTCKSPPLPRQLLLCVIHNLYSAFDEGYGSGVFAAKPAAGGLCVCDTHTDRKQCALLITHSLHLAASTATTVTAKLLVA